MKAISPIDALGTSEVTCKTCDAHALLPNADLFIFITMLVDFISEKCTCNWLADVLSKMPDEVTPAVVAEMLRNKTVPTPDDYVDVVEKDACPACARTFTVAFRMAADLMDAPVVEMRLDLEATLDPDGLVHFIVAGHPACRTAELLASKASKPIHTQKGA